MTPHRVDVRGEQLMLDADRALFWPSAKLLMVADVHLGKAHLFRRAGLAIPSGSTARDLSRLTVLIERYQPERLLILGDLVHGPSAPDAPWAEATRRWRHGWRELDVALIAGNHDRHFDARELGISVLGSELVHAPFRFVHEPQSAQSDPLYWLSGHVHPGIRIKDGRRHLRLAAFCFGQHGGLLPAFGGMTGLMMQALRKDQQIYAATPGGILIVPANGDAK